MDSQRVNMFLLSNKDFFPAENILQIKQQLLDLDDSQSVVLSCSQFKSPSTAMLMNLSALVGIFGVDRFYIGDIGIGIAKLLTAGGCGVWFIIDLFLIGNATRKNNYRILQENIDMSYTGLYKVS